MDGSKREHSRPERRESVGFNGCGGSKPPIPNTLQLQARATLIEPSFGFAHLCTVREVRLRAAVHRHHAQCTGTTMHQHSAPGRFEPSPIRPSVLHTFALCERSGCGRRCIGTMHNARARRCTSTLHRDDLSQVQSIIGLISQAAPCSRAHAHAPETAPAHAPTPCTTRVSLAVHG